MRTPVLIVLSNLCTGLLLVIFFTGQYSIPGQQSAVSTRAVQCPQCPTHKCPAQIKCPETDASAICPFGSPDAGDWHIGECRHGDAPWNDNNIRCELNTPAPFVPAAERSSYDEMLKKYPTFWPKRVPTKEKDLWDLHHKLYVAQSWPYNMPTVEATTGDYDGYTHRFGTVNIFFQGIVMQKYPSDLWIVQELFYKVRPEVVVETGTLLGGAAAYYAMLLHAMNIPGGKVITIDVSDEAPRHFKNTDRAKKLPYSNRIEFLLALTGSHDKDVIEHVRQATKGKRTIIFLDGNHIKPSVDQELIDYAPMVSVGSYIVTEDTDFNGNPWCSHPVAECGGGTVQGPKEAGDQWIKTATDFERDTSIDEWFHHSMNYGGYYKRIR
eukprot:TRINITY_DN1687_c0_g1_i3.p1 TRINITY_DN1687_c0_g1~~TRINITY_DN1687_c0_g1_i3.p1  ORF type:complete len:381 (+),score=45.90 TRINITY_DN1687_c0_g1_i3:54-1196(+)